MEILRVRRRSLACKPRRTGGREKTPSAQTEKPIILVDTREKRPFKFRVSERCGGCVVRKLDYGDYQVDGYPELVVVERKKSIDELCGNLGKHRERFERELQRMVSAGCKLRYVVVEDHYSSIFRKANKFSRLHPNSIFESIVALELKYGVRFLLCGSRKMAHRMTRTLLLRAHKYRLEGVL